MRKISASYRKVFTSPNKALIFIIIISETACILKIDNNFIL